jgi:hypothetical protein
MLPYPLQLFVPLVERLLLPEPNFADPAEANWDKKTTTAAVKTDDNQAQKLIKFRKFVKKMKFFVKFDFVFT